MFEALDVGGKPGNPAHGAVGQAREEAARGHGDLVTGGDPLDLGPHLRHYPRALVTDQGGHLERERAGEVVDVGPAQAAGPQFDLD